MARSQRMTLRDLGLEINHEGRLEEFYQRGSGYGVWSGLLRTGPGADSYMQEFHKSRRLELQAEYNARYAAGERATEGTEP